MANAAVQRWDTNYPDEELDPLTAVFVPDSNADPAVAYIAARFGAIGEDGTTIFEYAGARLAGSLSADGSVFAATQVSAQLQGAGVCVRTSGNKTVANVAGSYYGAWMSTQPVTGLTELLLDQRGQTVETVLVDSTGGRNYSLGQNFMLVKGPGQVDTRDANGAVSPGGRVMFIVQTDTNKFPTLVVYIRKTCPPRPGSASGGHL